MGTEVERSQGGQNGLPPENKEGWYPRAAERDVESRRQRNPLMRDILLIAAAAMVILLVVRGLRRHDAPLPDKLPADEWFQAEVVAPSEQTPVLVKFGATWCGYCLEMDPELDQVQSAVGSAARIVRIDVDERPELAQHFGISGIPRTLLFSGGKIVGDEGGLLRAGEIRNWLGKYMK